MKDANSTAIDPAIRKVNGSPIPSASAPMGKAPMGVSPIVMVNMLITRPCILAGVLARIKVLHMVI